MPSSGKVKVRGVHGELGRVGVLGDAGCRQRPDHEVAAGVEDRDRGRVVADRIGPAGVDEGGDRAAGMVIPSVPTTGKAETASGPWVTLAVARVPAVGPAGPKLIEIGTPLTGSVRVPPAKAIVFATVYVPLSRKVCVPVM